MNLIIVSLAVAAISTTICLTGPFRWLRVLLEPVPVFGKLLKCPYCLNHYFAIPAALLVDVDNIIDTGVNALAIVAMASMFGYILLKYLDLLEG